MLLTKQITVASAAPQVENYVNAGDSCPQLRVKYDVDIREFVILACVNDADNADEDDISRLLELSPTTVGLCVKKLLENGLIRASQEDPRHYRLTTDGTCLIRKASASGTDIPALHD